MNAYSTQHKMYVLRAGRHTFRANQMPSVSLCCYSKNRNDIRNRTFVFKFAHRIYGFFSNGAAERQRTCKLLSLEFYQKNQKPGQSAICSMQSSCPLARKCTPISTRIYVQFLSNFGLLSGLCVYLKIRFTLPNERR